MATIIDLNEASQTESQAACDVCIVGAGAAGLYLASRLARQGLSVVVLELGSASCRSGAEIGVEALFSGSRYEGSEVGRAFGWGGSTSRWGGLLAPHTNLDLRGAGSAHAETWSHLVKIVAERSRNVFEHLDLGSEPDFAEFPRRALGPHHAELDERGIRTMAAEFLPFRRRNLTFLAGRGGKGRLQVYLNAAASRWTIGSEPGGAVASVTATTATGKQLQVTASAFVVAAGAIESARILLEIQRSTGYAVIPPTAAIGRYLSDHLSAPIAEVVPSDTTLASRIFGPRFRRGRMRSFRFVDACAEPALPRHFAHFIFQIDDAGFRLAREAFSALQARSFPNLSPRSLLAAARGLWGLADHRFLRSRLFIPPGTTSHLQLDVEQTPSRENRVQLSTQLDRWGRPMSLIDWRVSDRDIEEIRRIARGFLRNWRGDGSLLPRLAPVPPEAERAKPHDAYHPVGTCRMGGDDEATVDLQLRVHGLRNLFVLSTAVLPSAGTANPTFTMLCLGDALSDLLAKPTSSIRIAK